MTTPDLRHDAPSIPQPLGQTSPSRLLASALLHLLDRDEPLPARWHADAFATAVARHRVVAGAMQGVDDLDRLARVMPIASFASAVDWLAREPMAAALAVRRLELLRGSSLPLWPQLVRYGLAPRVHASELGARSR